MKKILILHGENTYNYGTFMMLINFIYYDYRKNTNSREYYVCMNSDIDYERLKKELPLKISILKFKYNKKNESGVFFRKIIGLKYKFFDQINQIRKSKFDKVVILGGDDLSECYKGWLVFTDLLILIKLANITKLELIGQTVGPFYFWRKILARKLFNKSKLVVRDSLCADYLKKEINFKDFKISNDLAFLRLPFEDRRDYVIYKYKLKNNKYISIIPSGLYTCYSSSYEKYINNWLKIINTILKIDYLKDYELIFLGHVLKPGEYDDRKVIYKIKEKIDNSRCKFIFDELLPSEARTILGNGLLTLTGRMHPAISTFSKNKLAISLSYSIKYEGIIGRQLGLQETIIEKKNYWEDCIVDFKLKEALDDLAEKDKLKNFDISSKLDEVRRNIMEELFTD